MRSLRALLSVRHIFTYKLLLATVSCLLSLLGVELILHVIHPKLNYAYAPQQIIISHFRPSQVIPFELKRNNRSRFSMLEFDTTVVTNSLGLRGDEVDFRRPRILCMGDSFAFGFGVENDETFCARLERLFEGKYDFVNAGYADGFSPDTYALWLSKYGEKVRPDGIIVSVFQNDREDVGQNRWLRAGSSMDEAAPGLPDKIIRPGTLVTPDGAWLRDNFIARMPPVVRRLVKRSYLVALLRDGLLRDVDLSPDKSSDDAIIDRKFVRSLEMLLDVADGRLVAFYLIPEKSPKSSSRLDRLVNLFGSVHHIPVLANPGDFVEADYFRYDGHWTSSGHAKASRFLHRALVQIGF